MVALAATADVQALAGRRRDWRFSRHGHDDLARSEDRPAIKWRDCAEELRRTLGAAVKRELVSDVPVGVLLSGGLDSSAVDAFATEHYPSQIQTFSVAFDEPSFDERWDPPVTLGVRLVSIADDSLQHMGQAAYVRGLLDA